MNDIFSFHIKEAKNILKKNWTGTNTKPAPGLYPHQWSWDSAFIAIGKSRYNTSEAIKEIETLFDAQWGNGMIPQIVFNHSDLGHYFPEPDFWVTEISPDAPKNKLTSGITMPPVHSIAVWAILKNSHNTKAVMPFLEKIYPALMKFHEYLYNERDPGNEGLVYIRHPWESGIDNSPTWDIPLNKIKITKNDLPVYKRMDLNHGIDPKMRPTDKDYDRYVYLVNLFRENNYSEKKIQTTCPFLIQDPLFNSILCRANEVLSKIARLLGKPDDIPVQWYKKTSESIRKKLWHNEHAIFDAFDLVNNEIIEVDTAAGFLPLYAGAATKKQAEILYSRLNSASFCALNQGNCFTIPNYDTSMNNYDRKNYWRGPVWININWMISNGLKRYGYTLKADSIRKDLVQLPIRFGFHEYFDSNNGTGYGSNNFSWTAALFIDLVEEYYKKKENKILPGLSLIFQKKILLNSGHSNSDSDLETLAHRLMKSIKKMISKNLDPSRGIVNYQSLCHSDEFKKYRELTNILEKFDLNTLRGRKAKLAFWVNLYNAIIVDGIITLGIEKSVKEVPGFFNKIQYQIGDQYFSPDDIEHGILRSNTSKWKLFPGHFHVWDKRSNWVLTPTDPRVHFTLVCGSRSCAPVCFYNSDEIYNQLEIAAVSFINSSEVIVLPEKNSILISEIFKWYRADFGGRNGILDFIIDYLVDDESIKHVRDNYETIEIKYLYYDWSLNR